MAALYVRDLSEDALTELKTRAARNRQLTEEEWRERWKAERWFIAADGESGKRFGNETIRVTDTGEVSIKLPVPLVHLANAKHGRYVLAPTVAFAHGARRSAGPALPLGSGNTRPNGSDTSGQASARSRPPIPLLLREMRGITVTPR